MSTSRRIAFNPPAAQLARAYADHIAQQEVPKPIVRVPRPDPVLRSVWNGMLQRCRNPKCRSYDRYGGRGIRVCERWLTYENFLADVGPRPPGAHLHRLDNDGDYKPSNCGWLEPPKHRAIHAPPMMMQM